MKILLYNPDNGVTRNFMPHLWMFLLQSLTPAGHEVVLIDAQTPPSDRRWQPFGQVPAYRDEGKAYLTIAVGCTGGRHRSVAIAEFSFCHAPR